MADLNNEQVCCCGHKKSDHYPEEMCSHRGCDCLCFHGDPNCEIH